MHQLEERIHFRMEVAVVTGATLAIKEDASPMVRKELLVLISCLVKEWRGYFIVCAWIYWEEERRRQQYHTSHGDDDTVSQAVLDWLNIFDDESYREENRVWLSSFFTIYCVLLELSVDPYLEVATNAQTVVDYITALLLQSPFTKLPHTSLNMPFASNSDDHSQADARTRVPSHGSQTSTQPPPSPSMARPGLTRSDTMTSAMSSTISSGVTSTLRRTSSFANALRSLAGGIAFPSAEDGRSSPKPSISDNTRIEVPGVSRPPSPNLNLAQYTPPYPRPATPPINEIRLSPSMTTQSSFEIQPHPDFTAAEVMDALMEEDMERLRARRRTGSRPRHHGHAVQNAPMSSPSGSTFSVESSSSSIIVGLGTGVGIRDVLPLKSRFYDWCCEYFKEPQMRASMKSSNVNISCFTDTTIFSNQNPTSLEVRNTIIKFGGSSVTNIASTSHGRRLKLLVSCLMLLLVLVLKIVTELCRWDRAIVTLQTTAFPAQLAFHSYDNYLAVTNEADTIWFVSSLDSTI